MSSNVIVSTTLACLMLCGCASIPDPRYFDYSGSDGCSPSNLGHRLGGDLEQYSDNSLAGLRGIESLQGSPCFKNWEFDLTESADGLVLRNQSDHMGLPVSAFSIDNLPRGTVTASQLVREFSRVTAIKPIVIDLKKINSLQAMKEAKSVATQLALTQQTDIWFIASKLNASRMPQPCELLGGDFDLLLYSRGGDYCDQP